MFHVKQIENTGLGRGPAAGVEIWRINTHFLGTLFPAGFRSERRAGSCVYHTAPFTAAAARLKTPGKSKAWKIKYSRGSQ
jgi:hypothetical protein